MFGPDIKEQRYLTHAGMNGLHLYVSHPDGASLLRMFRSGPTLYTLSVEHLPGPVMPERIERDAMTFLDSLQIK
jgi:hypothetical protein